MAPTEAWKVMARYLEEQNKQADTAQLALTTAWNANSIGMPPNMIDRTDLHRAEDWVDERINDDSFDGEEKPSRMIRNSVLFRIVRREARHAADNAEHDEEQSDAEVPDDFEDGAESQPTGEPEDDEADHEYSGSGTDEDGDDNGHGRASRRRAKEDESEVQGEDKEEDHLSVGDSDDSSDDDSGRRGSGRGNRTKAGHRAPPYSQAEKCQVVVCYGKYFGREKLPRGIMGQIRRAFNKWLREQNVQDGNGTQLKRTEAGLRQKQKHLLSKGWKLQEGEVLAGPRKQRKRPTRKQTAVDSSSAQQQTRRETGQLAKRSASTDPADATDFWPCLAAYSSSPFALDTSRIHELDGPIAELIALVGFLSIALMTLSVVCYSRRIYETVSSYVIRG
ncbi:hypothetical protein LTR36_009184 [Oleoguttula mirabilis]|uniref:Transmembrane protein n=1 Tax=Oleoguttula mirabilis TaxID=1507867 RepID=A0AAV9J6N0_9PEZI|nr:hypothetical protein LTR36_009184 [Oleoguttula mirabilis]